MAAARVGRLRAASSNRSKSPGLYQLGCQQPHVAIFAHFKGIGEQPVDRVMGDARIRVVNIFGAEPVLIPRSFSWQARPLPKREERPDHPATDC